MRILPVAALVAASLAAAAPAGAVSTCDLVAPFEHGAEALASGVLVSYGGCGGEVCVASWTLFSGAAFCASGPP